MQFLITDVFRNCEPKNFGQIFLSFEETYKLNRKPIVLKKMMEGLEQHLIKLMFKAKAHWFTNNKYLAWRK